MFKKDDETDIGNHRPVSLLSVLSKILESLVNDTLVKHVHRGNNLVSDNGHTVQDILQKCCLYALLNCGGRQSTQVSK